MWSSKTLFIDAPYSPRLNVARMVEEMGYIEPIVLRQITDCDGETITGCVTFVYRKDAHNEK